MEREREIKDFKNVTGIKGGTLTESCSTFYLQNLMILISPTSSILVSHIFTRKCGTPNSMITNNYLYSVSYDAICT